MIVYFRTRLKELTDENVSHCACRDVFIATTFWVDEMCDLAVWERLIELDKPCSDCGEDTWVSKD